MMTVGDMLNWLTGLVEDTPVFVGTVDGNVFEIHALNWDKNIKGIVIDASEAPIVVGDTKAWENRNGIMDGRGRMQNGIRKVKKT